MPESVRFNSSYLNAKSSTGTATRVRDLSCTSGMCPICIKECGHLCEIGLSALRGREVLYPEPQYFGWSTAAALKDYGLDWAHFNILVSLIGAQGIEPDPDKATFPNVDISTSLGKIPLEVPVLIAGLGSTAVAKNNWQGLAIGAALSGTIVTVGENIVGMDSSSTFTDGKVTHSDDMEFRVNTFKKFWDGKHGGIMVQTNVEDQRLNTDLYASSKLEVTGIERKWGQGAKSIGGEVRITDLDKALVLKKRKYIVIPDPEDPEIQQAFKAGLFRSFERHSRVGMPNYRGFVEDVEWLRSHGVKHVSLKTGAYRPSAVAFTMKAASEAKVDYVTFDGAGGGTGMSPVPMMDESGTPTVYLEAQVLKCAEALRKHGRYVPDIAIAGGFINETQILKSIALSNFGHGPYVKAIATARSPITAVFKSEYFVELAKKGKLPKAFSDQYGSTPETFFTSVTDLKERFNDKVFEIPWGAIGLYTYFHDRIGVGLRQLMAGVRKWKLNLISRDDLISLSERAKMATGIPLPEEAEEDQMMQILMSQSP